MTHATITATAIDQLAQRDPSLLPALQETLDADQVTERIMASAVSHNITVNVQDVAALVRQAIRQAELELAIRELVSAEPSIEQALQNVRTVEEVAETILDAAKRHGVAIDAEELSANMRLVRKDRPTNELCDDALADVTGGLMVSTMVATGVVLAIGVVGTVLGTMIAYQLSRGIRLS